MTEPQGLDRAQPPVDEADRRRASEDLAHCYAVEAGAGTGKTRLLTDRFISAVISGVPVDRIVAITFTEMAAAELKGRIRDALEERRRKRDDETRERLLVDALGSLDRASITTIHSFCATLLREHPVEAGIDPSFSVMDKVQASLLFNDVWQSWLAAQLEEAGSVLGTLRYLGVRFDAVKELARAFHEDRDLSPFAREGRLPPHPLKDLDRLEKALGRLVDLGDRCRESEDGGLEQIEELAAMLRHMEPAPPEQRLLQLLKRLPDLKSSRGNQGNWEPGACKEQKELCKEINELRERMLGDLGTHLLEALFSELAAFLEQMTRAKQARGVLEFQDLLLMARDMLRDNKGARLVLQHSFDQLLVDEFQDTDPVQAEAIFFLAEDGALAEDWRDVVLKPGKLFIVGDPKQSIYRFRRADIEIYQQACDVIAKSGRRAGLVQNWRSASTILEWVNDVCGRLIEPCPEGRFQPEYSPLFPRDGAPGHAGLVLLDPDDDYVAGNLDAARRAEARAIAGWIRKACDGKREILDPDTGKPRPLLPGDVAILFPKTTGIEGYEEALRDAGLEFQIEGGKRFHSRPEARDLAAVLGALAYPEDELAVAAALRTSFFGLSNQDLLELRGKGGRFDFRSEQPGSSRALGEACDLLAELYRERHRLPLPRLLELFLERTKARELLLFLPRGEQAVMNLDKLVKMARYLGASTGMGVRELARWLRDMQDGKAEEPEVVPQEGGGAVRIITIHASKGLEFPVVILANLASGDSFREERIPDRSGGHLYVKLGGAAVAFTSCGWDEALALERRKQEAERFRLFYVAVTRARDHLVIPRFAASRAGGYLKDLARLEDSFADERIVTSVNAAELPRPTETLLARPQVQLPPGPMPDAGDLGEERAAWLAELAAVKAAAAPRLSQVTPSAEEGEFERPSAAAPALGPRLGSALHDLLETVDLAAPPAAIENLAAGYAAAHNLPGKEGKLAELARNCLESDVLARARAASRVWREVPFSLQRDDELLEGFIDLLFEENGGLVLVDYKSDALAAREVPGRVEVYRRQAELYAEAAAVATGMPVREAVLLFAAPAIEVSLELEPVGGAGAG
ncbi:MAG: UvrD-helicase domain-containing protein [Candidatus Geothermincolia bacterium]